MITITQFLAAALLSLFILPIAGAAIIVYFTNRKIIKITKEIKQIEAE